MVFCTDFIWQGAGSRGAAGAAPVRRDRGCPVPDTAGSSWTDGPYYSHFMYLEP